MKITALNSLYSLLTGCLFSLVFLSIYSLGNNSGVSYVLFIIAPVVLFVSIINFGFFTSLLSFIPNFFIIFLSYKYFFIYILFYFLPVFLVSIVLLLKNKFKRVHGGYIPFIISMYVIILLIVGNAISTALNFNLIDNILDSINIVSYQLHNINNEPVDIPKNIQYFIVLLVPSVAAIFFTFLTTLNYLVANFLVGINAPEKKFYMGSNLPIFYIYLFISILVITLVANYFFKSVPNIIFLLYSISIYMFTLFIYPGLGILSLFIKKSMFLLFLIVFIFFVSNLSFIILLCVLGFLKESKIINIENFI